MVVDIFRQRSHQNAFLLVIVNIDDQPVIEDIMGMRSRGPIVPLSTVANFDGPWDSTQINAWETPIFGVWGADVAFFVDFADLSTMHAVYSNTALEVYRNLIQKKRHNE